MIKETPKPHLHILDGGVGKHLQFSSLIPAIHKKYEQKLSITSAYPETLKNCPEVALSICTHVDPIVATWKNLLNKYDKIFYFNPYLGNFLKGDTHVTTEWSNLYDVKLNTVRPNFEINKEREKMIRNSILELGKFILVQFSGGQGILSNSYNGENQGRSYKYGQELINILKEEYPNINIIVFKHPNEQEEYLGETKSIFNTREDFMILSKYCLTFICIDSALQHMVSNIKFNKKGIVLWGATEPHRFGYENNVNIISHYPYCVEIPAKEIIDKLSKMEINND